MAATPTTATKDGLTVTAYAGDGVVLLGFSVTAAALKAAPLAGFAIQCTPPGGTPFFLKNRLSFGQAITKQTAPASHTWTPSDQAPFQKFHWVDFPADVVPGAFRYTVTARVWKGAALADGPSASVAISLVPPAPGHFELGFTRGDLSSQAYAVKFGNKDIRPQPKSLDFDTAAYQPQYEWLGYHGRRMIFALLKECVADPSITVDLFAYDFDEPDIVKMCEALGPRLRAVLDDASLHVKDGALEIQTHARLVKSAGASNVVQGHFKRFAHDKVIIQRKNGTPVKVLTGSANFSVRGLYVQANNVMLFDDPQVASLYDQVFESVFTNMSGFTKTPLAAKWFDFPSQPGVPDFSVSFAPHQSGAVSLAKVAAAVQAAKSSVLFAVMQLGGTGGVMSALQHMHQSGKVFSYGITQNEKGFSVYKPGEPGVLVPFAALAKHVPPPFDKEVTGGMGQVIHDKFIVIDFNDENPIVFTGSSNLAEGGESQNGDNLLAIVDKNVAAAFAIEAIRLVDHFHFRAAVEAATDVEPLQLQPAGATPAWYEDDYDPNDIRNLQRLLFASGPSSVTKVPSGGAGNTLPAPSKPPLPAKKPVPVKKPATPKKPAAPKKPPRRKTPVRRKKPAARKRPTRVKRSTKKRARPSRRRKG